MSWPVRAPGKTTVLIERFRGLVESGVSPLRILAITFTEKATSQMRERLARAFADQPDLILQIQRAYVSTVHGFCTRLLRENAILAGVDPRFRVLNEQEAFALERKSVDDALDEFLAEIRRARTRSASALRSPDLGDSILEIYRRDASGRHEHGGLGRARSGNRRPVGARRARARMWTNRLRGQLARARRAAWRAARRSRSRRLDFQILAGLPART